MRNETKLERLKKFLSENGIEYIIPKRHGKKGHSDIVLPKFRVSVKIEGDDACLFYQRHKAGKYPVFIRTEDTPKFVIEKVQGAIIKSMTSIQSHLLKKRKK